MFGALIMDGKRESDGGLAAITRESTVERQVSKPRKDEGSNVLDAWIQSCASSSGASCKSHVIGEEYRVRGSANSNGGAKSSPERRVQSVVDIDGDAEVGGPKRVLNRNIFCCIVDETYHGLG